MKFIAIDDSQDPWDEIRDAIGGDTVALTADGKPIALAVELQDHQDPCELERSIRLVRFQQAVARIREEARRNGTDQLTIDEIDEEIRAVRAERRRPEGA
jgi:antitoxin (DNA-binding transcriptional repressor) of toxin-antitoxin stability system